jgi:hypothetical protein
MPKDLALEFEEEYNVEPDYIKQNLYKEPNPNAYLATFAKFLIKHKVANSQLIMEGGELSSMVDYFMCENGKTYCLPLITTNNDFLSYEENIKINRNHHVICRELYYDWWKNDRDKFTLEDFFTYKKPYDYLMTKIVNK